jgi:hypothetical protein
LDVALLVEEGTLSEEPTSMLVLPAQRNRYNVLLSAERWPLGLHVASVDANEGLVLGKPDHVKRCMTIKVALANFWSSKSAPSLSTAGFIVSRTQTYLTWHQKVRYIARWHAKVLQQASSEPYRLRGRW